MKFNRKGFTLIELLVTICIVALVVGFTAYGLIEILNSSKKQSNVISSSNILSAAGIYSTEKNDDSERWIEVNNDNNKYFCTTVEELINNGLLDKKAKLQDDNITKFSYISIKKDKLTFTTSSPKIITDTESVDYSVCSGNLKKENIITYPTLGDSNSYTDTIEVSFTDGEAESAIKERKCEIGNYPGQDLGNGSVVNGKCVFEDLKDDSTYYVRVCMTTEKDSYICSNSEGRNTKKVVEPVITINNNINIKYDNSNIKGEASYYFTFDKSGTSNIGVQECSMSNDKYICQDGNTLLIKENTWYKSPDKNIIITSISTGDGKIKAITSDKSNNTGKTEKDVSIYAIRFKKGTADKIGDSSVDLNKFCIAEKNKTCSITSPSIEREGYIIVGWNNNENATTSNWDVGTSKNINSSATYYPITKLDSYTIKYNANGGNKAPASQNKIKDKDLILSTVKPTRKGYTFKGWGISSTASEVLYAAGDTYKDNKDITLYAIWQVNTITIKFNTNGGTVQASSTSNTGNVYKWKQDNNGLIYRTNANGDNYSDSFLVIDYGSTTGADGLPNIANSKYLNITKTGYGAVYGKEWKCISGCTKSDNTYNESSSYTSGSFCDASGASCAVVLGVNWEKTKQTYAVKYDANGGTGAPTLQAKKEDVVLTLSNTKPVRSNYEFVSWNTEKDGTGTSYMPGSTYSDNAAVTLYAQWRDTRQYLYYDNNGGTGCSYKVVTKGSQYGTLCKPTRNGYTFVGWFDSNYKDIPLNYYADNNSDVYAYFKYDASLLYKHYLTYGKDENRRISQYISTDTFNEDGNKTIYAGWLKFFILESITPTETVKYATVEDFNYPYICKSSIGISNSNCKIQANSTDCALKSSSGKTTNCLSSSGWYDMPSVTINAYYYTSNSNVNSATASTNNSRHCINYRAVGTDSSGNTVVSDNVITKCYTITK